MLIESVLLPLIDPPVIVNIRRVLNQVLRHRQHDLVAVEPGTVDRREALPVPNMPVVTVTHSG
jgi:hypothetical protein